MAEFTAGSTAASTARGRVEALTEQAAGPPSKVSGFFLVAVSAWLVFHLGAVFVMPYSESYFSQWFQPVIEPYLGALGLQSTWRFFAPEPMTGVQQLEIQVIDAEGAVTDELLWGMPKDRWKFLDRTSRWNSVGFQMASFPDRAEVLLKGMICNRPEKPRSYRVFVKFTPLPLLADVASGRRAVGDGVGAEKKLLVHGFCS